MNTDEQIARIRSMADDSSILRKAVAAELGPQIVDFAAVIAGAIGAGGKILIGGNGGSAADACHMAAEMVVRLTKDRNRQALPAIALGMDPAVLTAASNDLGFQNAIARQVEAIGNKGDMLLVISTSGASDNLVKAVRLGRKRGLLTAGLLGGDGGRLATLVERALIIPHGSVQRIQEEHIFVIHVIVELIESDLFG